MISYIRSKDYPKIYCVSFFLKHLLWTTLCPGTVTLLIPWLLLADDASGFHSSGWTHWLGLFMIGAGCIVLFSCILMFARFGKGTLSPFDPARHLVIKGLYRYVRNPMYIGVLIILLGEALTFQSVTLLGYAGIVFVVFNAFILLYEEQYLRRQFGAQYDHYCKRVRRWVPRKPYIK